MSEESGAYESGEDLTGLKNTVAALREEKRQLKTQLSELSEQYQSLHATYADLDIAQAREAISQLPMVQQQLSERTSEINRLTLDSHLNAATAEVVPKYRGLVVSHLRSQVQLSEGEVKSTDGRSLSDLMSGMRESTPEFFLSDKPIGTNTIGQGAGSAPAAQVQAQNGIIRGVDPSDVLAGKVTISY